MNQVRAAVRAVRRYAMLIDEESVLQTLATHTSSVQDPKTSQRSGHRIHADGPHRTRSLFRKLSGLRQMITVPHACFWSVVKSQTCQIEA